MTVALVGLGSNAGERQELLQKALAVLAREVCLERCSPLYQTQPWGLPAEVPWFLNAVVRVRTPYSAEELWALCTQLEHLFGRRRSGVPDPVRPLDLDVLLYGELIVRADHLCIPHPRLHQRRFVLQPAADIAPEMRHPLFCKTIAELLQECADPAWVRLYAQPPGECLHALP